MDALSAGDAIDGLFSFRKTGATDVLMAICDGKLFAFNPATPAWSQVGSSAPFTVGATSSVCFFRDQAFICDGTAQQRFNGTALLPIGFAAPTGAPALSAVAASASGVTGDYEGFAVWYDAATTHESDRSALSATVTLAGQARQWVKPAGSPPANVTHWRVYCRRVDTNETNFYRCAEVAVATGTVTEEVADATRREPGPKPNVNGVPPVFAWLSVWQGYGIGATADSANFYVTKLNDLESVNPVDSFLVQRNRALRSGRPYGTEFLVQTEDATFRLVGTAPPFRIEQLHSEFGNVAQAAALEVDGWFYAWDRRRGPYRTNTNDWQSLAEAPIATTLGGVSAQYMAGIRAVYAPAIKTILWAVPGASARRQTILGFHVPTGAWLPPMDGIEFGALTTHVNDAGAIKAYAGDYRGRVWLLFNESADAPLIEGTDLEATIASATTSSIVATGATFATDGEGLAGCPAAVLSPAGAWQWVRIASNTGDTLTLDTTNGPELDPVPSGAGWTVYVGAIRFEWATPVLDFGDPTRKKRVWHVDVQAETPQAGDTLFADILLDGDRMVDSSLELELPVSNGGLIWGLSLWDVGTWDGPTSTGRTPSKRRVWRVCHQIQIRFYNYRPKKTMALLGYWIGADWTDGRSPSAQ